jgi:pimeloyl-ACP methyl ester carboxylesterase
MKYYLLALTAALFSILKLAAQTDPNWDNTDLIQWSHGFLKVEISSSLDGNKQEAYLYASHSSRTKPLIVSLHTWSGDFKQKDPIANEILARDWNYIHPDFRGSNDKPDAACSKFVLSDIEDAIRYAIKNTNADPEDVHIIGVSGGAMVTLAAYMNIQYPVKSFSAWVPISNLEAWYWESVGRKQKYAADILKIVSVDSIFNAEEARLRSPLFQKFPRELRKNAELYLYAGIHDGYEGSVPITHSINMYNRLIGELRYNTNNMNQIMQEANMDSNLVSREDIISLLTRQFNPEYKHNESLFDRNVYLSRRYENVELTIFEGGHEQIPQALSLIPHKDTTSLKFNILTIGDSNGNNKGGWVVQLRKIMP